MTHKCPWCHQPYKLVTAICDECWRLWMRIIFNDRLYSMVVRSGEPVAHTKLNQEQIDIVMAIRYKLLHEETNHGG